MKPLVTDAFQNTVLFFRQHELTLCHFDNKDLWYQFLREQKQWYFLQICWIVYSETIHKIFHLNLNFIFLKRLWSHLKIAFILRFCKIVFAWKCLSLDRKYLSVDLTSLYVFIFSLHFVWAKNLLSFSSSLWPRCRRQCNCFASGNIFFALLNIASSISTPILLELRKLLFIDTISKAKRVNVSISLMKWNRTGPRKTHDDSQFSFW